MNNNAIMPAHAEVLKSGTSLCVQRGAVGEKLTDWYQIPSWLAGSYQCLQSSPEEIHFYGHQQDSGGSIWHAVFMPYREDCLEGGVMLRYELLQRHMANKNNKQVVVTDKFQVSKTGTKEPATEVSISTVITPATPGTLHFVSTIIERDLLGKVIKETSEESDWRRTEIFHNMDTYYGHNLKSEFDDFLAECGHGGVTGDDLRRATQN